MQVSIGFIRSDDDFQLLATLNNNDGILSEADFDALILSTIALYLRSVDESVKAYIRVDAPDYLDVADNFGEEYKLENLN
jgi:hypothetical protein